MKRIELNIKTIDRSGFYDITDEVTKILDDECSLINLFLPHTTAALIISDKVPQVNVDTNTIFSRIFPLTDPEYTHRSPNSDAHIKNIVCGVELTIPVQECKLFIGEWQRIFLAEGDGPKDSRKVICTLL
jgi:secondary thiamine-phosphate synthase enzyme